jgi:membrane-bound lytic murein transglycosylase B
MGFAALYPSYLTANFEAMREWNRATIYRKTIGYFADRPVGR